MGQSCSTLHAITTTTTSTTRIPVASQTLVTRLNRLTDDEFFYAHDTYFDTYRVAADVPIEAQIELIDEYVMGLEEVFQVWKPPRYVARGICGGKKRPWFEFRAASMLEGGGVGQRGRGKGRGWSGFEEEEEVFEEWGRAGTGGKRVGGTGAGGGRLLASAAVDEVEMYGANRGRDTYMSGALQTRGNGDIGGVYGQGVRRGFGGSGFFTDPFARRSSLDGGQVQSRRSTRAIENRAPVHFAAAKPEIKGILKNHREGSVPPGKLKGILKKSGSRGVSPASSRRSIRFDSSGDEETDDDSESEGYYDTDDDDEGLAARTCRVNISMR